MAHKVTCYLSDGVRKGGTKARYTTLSMSRLKAKYKLAKIAEVQPQWILVGSEDFRTLRYLIEKLHRA